MAVLQMLLSAAVLLSASPLFWPQAPLQLLLQLQPWAALLLQRLPLLLSLPLAAAPLLWPLIHVVAACEAS